ncbi:Uma2 family endonuclease [Sphingomonas bacterium]|uniref:Uma2 family endonuclease n=1 Tax=Sphingomonas bacterium TaxID=1895847 RepID=UPI001575765E|nr:Uma2 family endonuclease [Sphingomonas bacterium]
MATQSVERALTVDEFLRIDFGSDMKAELDNGVIRMMAGGSRAHDRVQINLIVSLANRLRGSGCRPSGSDMGVRTHDGSLRYPDVSVTCGRNGPADDRTRTVSDPCVVIEVLSPTTSALDRGAKLDEYKALTSVETIVLIDPDAERLRVLQRTGRDPDGWSDVNYTRPHELSLASLGLAVPHDEIFTRD